MRFLMNASCVFLFAFASVGVLKLNADTLNGAGGGWQNNWSSANLVDGTSPTPGTPYWNNTSGDGAKMNVGWCMAGGGNCSLSGGAPGVIPYYGTSSGASVPDMYFSSAGNAAGSSLQVSLTSQHGGNGNGYDIFGYYLTNSSGTTISSRTQMFNFQNNSPAATFNLPTLSSGQNYGFYIENIQGGGTANESDYFYYMDSGNNSSTGMPADSLQHFAVFDQSPTSFYIGAVDADSCMGTFTTKNSPCNNATSFDYQDVVIQLTVATPEPGTAPLFGASMVLLAALFLRRKRRLGAN